MTTEPSQIPTTAWYQKKRSRIIALAVLGSVLLILVSLPYGIQYGLADFLRQHGARQVQISNIDFNPFSGRLLFEAVAAESATGEALRLDRLELEFGWRDLFAKRARIRAIDLQGLQASLDLSDPSVVQVSGLSFPLGDSGGEAAVSEADDSSPWGFALDRVVLRACSFRLKQQDLQLEIELTRLGLQRVISWQLQQAAELALEGHINQAPFNIELRAMLFDETPEIEGDIELTAFDLSALQPLLSRADGPELEGKFGLGQAFKLSLNPAGEVQWEADGTLVGEGLNTIAPGYQGREITAHWQGTTRGSWSDSGELGLELDGEVAGSLPQLRLPEQSMEISLAAYRWAGRLLLEQATPGLALQADGALTFDQATVEQAQAQPARLSLRQLGLRELSLQLQNDETGLRLEQRSELRLQGLAVQQHRLLAELDSLQWQGDFSLRPGEGEPLIGAAGEGHFASLELKESQADLARVSLQQADLKQLKLSAGNDLALASLVLQGIVLDDAPGASETPALESRSLSFRDLHYAQAQGLSIALVEQQGLRARLVLDKAGQLNLQQLAERLQAAAVPAQDAGGESQTGQPEGEGLPIRIDRVAWVGENQAEFSDLSVQPPFRITLEAKTFEMSGIDSSQPGKPSPFRFVGSTGRHALVNAEGEITLFQSEPDARLTAELKGVEMLPLSSYTVPAIGYNLDSGELDAKIDLVLKQGNMDGSNRLIIRRLDVSQASEAEAEKLKAQISMPLDTALGMLQDKNQTIDLKLPISGKLSDPNVALGDVINTALGNALKKGAMTYLTTALFPYGTMVALLKMAGEEAAAVRLAPVEFPPAATSLDDTDRDYLGKVAQVLKERPKIAIKLCGSATQTDRQAMTEALASQMAKVAKAEKADGADKPGDAQPRQGQAETLPPIPDEQLLSLARQRAEAVEDYLVRQHGLSASRTAICRPVIDTGETAIPRVDLQI